MRLLMGFLYLLFSLNGLSEPAVVTYLDYFGDYLIHEPYSINFDPATTTVTALKAEITTRLGGDINSTLVLVGYGEHGISEDFFAASHNTNGNIPLAQAFAQPSRERHKKWYFYFVDKSIAHYVTDRKSHHGSSPFLLLAEVGLRDLIWF
jgi:hypothetical protein